MKKEKETNKEEKIARSESRYLRISSQKVNLVVREIRGFSLEVAKNKLKVMTKKAASILLKTLKSAENNAKGLQMNIDKLYISRIEVGQGPSLKRGQPVSRGSSHPIIKRTTHVLLELKEENNGSES